MIGIAGPPTAFAYQVGVPEPVIVKSLIVALAEAKKDCAFATGATGDTGWLFMDIGFELFETHPLAFVTV